MISWKYRCDPPISFECLLQLLSNSYVRGSAGIIKLQEDMEMMHDALEKYILTSYGHVVRDFESKAKTR